MSKEPPSTAFASPFVRSDAMMMSDVLSKLDKVEVTEIQRRDLKSAIRSVCRLLDRSPAEVPANTSWVRIALRRIHPVQAGISEKRLKNIRASVLKALELYGASRLRSDWQSAPTAEWEALLATVFGKPDSWRLSRLAQYCTAVDVPPHKVSDVEVLGLLAVLQSETFIAKPEDTARQIVLAWNRLKQAIPEWPQIVLTFPRRKEPWTFPMDQFPKSLQDDVEIWIDRLANPDPLSTEGPSRALRPATIEYWRFALRQVASAIVHSGTAIDSITDLASLLDLDRLRAGLRFLLNRYGGKPTEMIYKLATCMKSVARYHVKVVDTHQKELDALCRRLVVKQAGLRAKNQSRLEQLDDDRNLARLLHLPMRLRDAAKVPSLSVLRRALLVQCALSIEILLHAPMRIGNLSALSLERHIRRARVKGVECLVVTIPASEVKNSRDLSFELTGDTLELYDLYMKEHRPVLLGVPSEYLFPAKNGGPKPGQSLSTLIKETILAHTGLVIHAHLFRSIAGKIHCMISPGDFLTLSHAIGDSHATTMKSYAQFEQKNAVRHYHASVSKARQQLSGGKK